MFDVHSLRDGHVIPLSSGPNATAPGALPTKDPSLPSLKSSRSPATQMEPPLPSAVSWLISNLIDLRVWVPPPTPPADGFRAVSPWLLSSAPDLPKTPRRNLTRGPLLNGNLSGPLFPSPSRRQRDLVGVRERGELHEDEASAGRKPKPRRFSRSPRGGCKSHPKPRWVTLVGTSCDTPQKWGHLLARETMAVTVIDHPEAPSDRRAWKS